MIADPRRIIEHHAGPLDRPVQHHFVDRKVVHRFEINGWSFAALVLVLLVAFDLVQRAIS